MYDSDRSCSCKHLLRKLSRYSGQLLMGIVSGFVWCRVTLILVGATFAPSHVAASRRYGCRGRCL